MSMDTAPGQLSYLLNNVIGKRFILNNIEKYVSYHKLSSKNHYPNINLASLMYDSNNLEDILNKDIFVTKLGDCYSTLDLLNLSYNSLLIEQTEFILIRNGKLNILTLFNSKKPNTGLVMIIDMAQIENELVLENARRNSYLFMFQTSIESKKSLIAIWGGLAFGIGVGIGLALFR